MSKRGWLVAALLLGLAVPGRASAQISDAKLGERVAETVRNYSQFSIFDDINIQIDNRAITLTGWVTRPNKRDEISARVAKVDGVRSVTDNINVLPVSRTDDDLRWRISNAIYNHPNFWTYAQQANPPIHIIVDNGEVTLTGVVSSDTDKALAFSLTQVRGIRGVTNKLRVDPR
jgi:hyperosmotically inducible protein